MDFYDATGATRLNLVSTAADLKLGGNFVTTAAEFNATMVRSGNSITITLGSQISGTLVTAGAGHDDVAAVGERDRRRRPTRAAPRS